MIRQLLTESILLSLLGGAFGVVLANWTGSALFRFLPQGHIGIALDLHTDSRALLFTFTLSLFTGILFGLAPALQATRVELAAALKANSGGSRAAGQTTRVRKILVISQVAFSLVLLMATGIFVHTLSDLRPSDYQTDPARVLLFTMKPQPEIYTPERKRMLAAELIRRMSQLPGVQGAALAENGPLGSRSNTDFVQTPGGDSVEAETDVVTFGFFDTIGIKRIAGRDFTPADKPGSPAVAIVNRSLARAIFKNENPIGRSLTSGKNKQAFEIIGVVSGTHYYDVHHAERPAVWFTFQGEDDLYMPTLHVRTATSSTAGIVSAIRREFDLLDNGFPIFNIKTLHTRIEESLSRERMVADISAVFGLLALTLAGVGLYGILAYSISRRTRELGIRIALGSSSISILSIVAGEALLLVGGGCVAGIGIAFGASRLLSRYLAGVSPLTPSVLIACVGTMLAITIAAVFVPSVRACRTDPLTALRHE